MSTISAALVKDLRDKTGAGMMDCKAALGETNGDIEAAVDWLRKKGLAKAAKKAGRVAAEGLIGLAQGGASAALVEVNSETDFVARNPEFQALVTGIAGVALKTGTDVAAISAAPLGGATVAEKLASAIATIGENMTLRRAARLEVSAGAVGTYMHAAAAPGLGKIGVLVGLQSAGQSEALAQFGKMLAMHIAAANPLAVEPEQIDPAVVAREKAVLADKAAAAGKPANMIEKIVEGGIKTYFKEVCLLSQAYIHDPSKTVTQALKEAEAAAGAPVKVTAFIRFALGEGIEKQESDFAAEVAAAVKG